MKGFEDIAREHGITGMPWRDGRSRHVYALLNVYAYVTFCEPKRGSGWYQKVHTTQDGGKFERPERYPRHYGFVEQYRYVKGGSKSSSGRELGRAGYKYITEAHVYDLKSIFKRIILI